MKLKFLGTGGGRYVTGKQERRTAGIILETNETTLHIDPGPGALVYANKELKDTSDIDAVLVSHAHLDHFSDAEPIIELITQVHNKPGILLANETVLNGYSDMDKAVSNYHQELCQDIHMLEEESEAELEGIKIKSQQMFHSDPKTVGFKVNNGDKEIGFWTDSEFSEELLKFYKGVETLVVYCSRPKNSKVRSHTYLNDVKKIDNKLGVKNIIITHFGQKFLNSDLDEQKSWIKESTEASITFAEDNMEYPGNKTLNQF